MSLMSAFQHKKLNKRWLLVISKPLQGTNPVASDPPEHRLIWHLRQQGHPPTVFCKISVQKNQQCLEFSMNRCRCLLYRRKIAIPTVLRQENDFQYWFHWSFNSILIESTNCWNVNSETSVRDFRVTFTANGQIQVENFSKYKLKENEQNWNLIV